MLLSFSVFDRSSGKENSAAFLLGIDQWLPPGITAFLDTAEDCVK